MPRYYFNMYDGNDHPDLEGADLPDIPAARRYAVRYFGELLQGDPSHLWQGQEWKMEVADANGLILFALHFIGLDGPSLRNPGLTILA